MRADKGRVWMAFHQTSEIGQDFDKRWERWRGKLPVRMGVQLFVALVVHVLQQQCERGADDGAHRPLVLWMLAPRLSLAEPSTENEREPSNHNRRH